MHSAINIPGFRVPFYMVSSWTRGGRIFERADHNSQILFLEEWLSACGYSGIRTDRTVKWHREYMSNLVNALHLHLDNICFYSCSTFINTLNKANSNGRNSAKAVANP
jgi:hypothetical protein